MADKDTKNTSMDNIGSTTDYAKQAFTHVYNSDPAEFNKVAQQAIKNAVREKIKTIRGEIRDELADKILAQEKNTPAPVMSTTVVSPAPAKKD
jgi:hypothetical protein